MTSFGVVTSWLVAAWGRDSPCYHSMRTARSSGELCSLVSERMLLGMLLEVSACKNYYSWCLPLGWGSRLETRWNSALCSYHWYSEALESGCWLWRWLVTCNLAWVMQIRLSRVGSWISWVCWHQGLWRNSWRCHWRLETPFAVGDTSRVCS